MTETERFKLEVQHEIETIRTKATQEEKSKLNLSTFEPTDAHTCIYGQMTGNCFSSRAHELTPKSYESVTDGYRTFGTNFTALEKYIFVCPEEDHESIINFIKTGSSLKLTWKPVYETETPFTPTI